jgi:hypothetical protein
MGLPFFMSCNLPSVGLYHLDDGRFQLIKDGPIAPFMYGPDYFLITRELANLLEELDIPRVHFEPAVIWDRGINQEHRTHVRLVVSQWFSVDQIKDLDLDGYRLLTLGDEYLFVSPTLKEKLDASDFKYLCFSEGLSEFACAST